MKPIELNLASNPYRNDAPLTVGLSLLLVLALGFTFFNAYAYLTADGTKDGLVTKLADHRATMTAMRQESEQIREELAQVDAEVLGAQANFVAGILAQRNFSWTALLNALEEVLPWNVRLSVIRPEFDTLGRVTLGLRGTGHDVEAFYSFQERLEGSKFFSEVVPGSWQYSDRFSQNDDTVEFVLRCRYEQAEAEDEAEVLEAGLSLDGEGEDARIVVEGEAEPGAEPESRDGVDESSEGALLEDEPVVERGGSPPSAAAETRERAWAPGPETPAAAGEGARSDAPETRKERRARRARALAGGGAGVVGRGRAGRAAADGNAADAPPPTPGSPRGQAARRARTAPPGAAAAVAGTVPGTAGGTPGTAANEKPTVRTDIPREEIVQFDEEGNPVNVKLRRSEGQNAASGEEGGGSGGSGSSNEGSSSGSSGGSSSGSGSGSSSGGGAK